jgi:hypothetical protein
LREGEKTTPVEQLAPAARVVPQVFCARLNGGVTARVSEVAAERPVFVMVTVCEALDCPGATMGKTS